MLVVDATYNATKLGEADSESSALMILRAHFDPLDIPLVGARPLTVLLRNLIGDEPPPDGERMLEAWCPVTRPNDVLAAIGRLIHGANEWQLPLADDLGVNRETVRRWMTDRTRLDQDHGVFEDLLRVMDNRIHALSVARDHLARWVEAARR